MQMYITYSDLEIADAIHFQIFGNLQIFKLSLNAVKKIMSNAVRYNYRQKCSTYFITHDTTCSLDNSKWFQVLYFCRRNRNKKMLNININTS